MSRQLPLSGLTVWIKPSLILAYLACDYAALAERVGLLGHSASFGLFLVLYGLCALGLVLAAYIPVAFVRIPLALLFASASVLQQAFEWTMNGPLTYEAMLNLYMAVGQTDEALEQHGHILFLVVPVATLLLVGMALPPRGLRMRGLTTTGAPLAALFVLTAIFYVRGGEGSRGLPAALPPVSLAGIMAAEHFVNGNGPRRNVAIARSGKPVGRDIVLLVDESVAGNYLDINNPLGVRSGLADTPVGGHLVNFGYAAAIHSCSANTNLVLRYGGTRENYQEKIASQPSIWSYAAGAGLRTVYIDGQSAGGRLQNMMTAAERAEIDDFMQLDGTPVLERDMRIADLLAERINNDTAEFIYINKVGAHFPIKDKFPARMMRYRPVLERGPKNLLSWSSDRTGFTGTPQEWVRYRNSYRNTLLWNVGTFFDRFLDQADLSRATIIYTSDHGQDLHERGNPGNNTHCGVGNGSQEEGLVPLAVIEGDTVSSLDWTDNLDTNRNRISHFRIFPTLLVMMGYDRSRVRQLYGPAMDTPETDPFSYNVRFTNHLGRSPEYRHIELDDIVDPPASDYGDREQ